MTIIYLIVSLMVLLVVFLIAYLVRGPKFALRMSVAAFFALSVMYVALVMFATSQMP